MNVTAPVAVAVPRLSVIVPAFNCASMLQRCLHGLVASGLPRDAWELIVVDDGSGDDTGPVARAVADRVLRVEDGPRGPAHARNVGARVATGAVLVFVDADVIVAPTTLRGFADHFVQDAALGAVFGAYDETPADTGFLSQYRNLVHHYVHATHRGDAETFWAGCGAVRRDLFLAAGGFHAARYTRPQIEDIELGYRLRARGARIRLDPALQGTHLKHWTLRSMLRTDLRDRAIPWMRLILRRGEAMQSGPLNLELREKAFTVLTALSVVAALAALVTQRRALAAVAVACVLTVLLGNAALLAWFVRARGVVFTCGVVPLRLLYYVEAGLGAAWAIVTYRGRDAEVVLPPLTSAAAPSAP
jgi:hypothetical protein